ncbi:MAG: tetratricopeptide repeat protein [Chloroflexota bacterium]|nr:tetratricopeptide repeat protein [Chloroflexota bacterium]
MKRLGLGSNSILILGVALVLLSAGVLLAPALAQHQAAPVPALEPAVSVSSAVAGTLGSADRTISTMQARAKQDAGDYAAFAALGMAFQQKARETNDPTFYTQAEDAFKKCLDVKSDSYDCTAGMGALDLSKHQFGEALNWGNKAQKLLPTRAYSYGVSGDAYIELGQYDQAVNSFQRMIDLRPDLSSYSRVSYARELNGDVLGAIAAMEQAVEAGGPAAENTAWCRVQLGNLYFNSNQLGRAENEYLAALQGYPNYLHAQAGLAQVRWAQGKSDEAIKFYEQSVSLVPLPQYLASLGDVYSARGDIASAQKQYDLVGAIYHIFEASGVNVNMEKAAFLSDHDKDLQNAARLAEEAAATRQDVHTLDTLAWARYKVGRYPQALEAEKGAMRLGTRNALFYYHLGMIYEKLGDHSSALQNVKQAIQINPYFSPLHSAEAAKFVLSEGK